MKRYFNRSLNAPRGEQHEGGSSMFMPVDTPGMKILFEFCKGLYISKQRPKGHLERTYMRYDAWINCSSDDKQLSFEPAFNRVAEKLRIRLNASIASKSPNDQEKAQELFNELIRVVIGEGEYKCGAITAECAALNQPD